jgi:hypothetical protein
MNGHPSRRDDLDRLPGALAASHIYSIKLRLWFWQGKLYFSLMQESNKFGLHR